MLLDSLGLRTSGDVFVLGMLLISLALLKAFFQEHLGRFFKPIQVSVISLDNRSA